MMRLIKLLGLFLLCFARLCAEAEHMNVVKELKKKAIDFGDGSFVASANGNGALLDKNGKLFSGVIHTTGPEWSQHDYHSYQAGKLNGISFSYGYNSDESDRSDCHISNYKDGLLHGRQYWYDGAGSLVRIEMYVMGRLHGFQCSFGGGKMNKISLILSGKKVALEKTDQKNGEYRFEGGYVLTYRKGELTFFQKIKDSLVLTEDLWFAIERRKMLSDKYSNISVIYEAGKRLEVTNALKEAQIQAASAIGVSELNISYGVA